MLNRSKFYGLIPVLMTLMFSQGHRVTGKLNLCSHSVVKLHGATRVFVMVDYVKEMTMKSCKSCEYGSLERLLFLVLL